MQKSAFEKISIGPAFESFLVFLVLGILVVVVGGCFVDLTSDLPDWYLSLIQEPVSISYFFILSILSLLTTALVTWGGTKNHNDKWWFDNIVLATSRAGISCGFIASGMLVGIGAGLFIVTRGSPDSELANTSMGFVALGIYCLAVVYPVSLLMLYMINKNTKHNIFIDLLGALYITLVISASYKFREHMNWIVISACFAVLIICMFIDRNWLRKTDNKRLHTDPIKAGSASQHQP
ncbi:hypothetical protein [Alishewanella sp. SMS8]|uniref:hypothetical protein n=1 Tax=Alishewanella sp. SMS8 TaxID=2994676 RepID=UPI002740B0D5|nr:hypothetical protein [Alishewanella sp. SMS8]MDP5460485.1 hypothetical protein [Alishewanella sp. SMS8]